MKLKTVRVRRSRPSSLALALALMLTMLCVYCISLSASPEAETEAASAGLPGSSEVRMEGMEVAFDCEGRYPTLLEAQVMSAYCAQSGGAGLILQEDGQYAVVRSVTDAPGENGFSRSAPGLTLKLKGEAGEIAAIADSADFLYALATETAALPVSMERGEADAASIRALMDIYITQGRRLQTAIGEIPEDHALLRCMGEAMTAAMVRLRDASNHPEANRLRALHAGTCADWTALLQELSSADPSQA